MKKYDKNIKQMEKYEKIWKMKKRKKHIEKLAPGPKMHLRPSDTLLWISGGQPLCAMNFQPPENRFREISVANVLGLIPIGF